jgi:hypothetical protein
MNERQVANKALELADKLVNILTFCEVEWSEYDDDEILQQAADMLRSQEKYINRLHKLLNYNGIGAGRDLLTGEVIGFEVDDEPN